MHCLESFRDIFLEFRRTTLLSPDPISPRGASFDALRLLIPGSSSKFCIGLLEVPCTLRRLFWIASASLLHCSGKPWSTDVGGSKSVDGGGGFSKKADGISCSALRSGSCAYSFLSGPFPLPAKAVAAKDKVSDVDAPVFPIRFSKLSLRLEKTQRR
jgi:hypothetical protein